MWLKRFAEDKNISDVSDIRILRKHTGGDPIATIPNEIVSNGIMVTGGAAGQSGIGYGMRAGEICGMVAAKAIASSNTSKNALSEYRRIWGKEFKSEYMLGRSALETLRKLDNKEIDRLTGMFTDVNLTRVTGTGSPMSQAIRVMRFMLRNDPKTTLSLLAPLIKAGIG